MTEAPEQPIDPNYCPSLQAAEWFVILSRGSMGFRYGPYAPEEAGAIMSQCHDEGIPCLVTGNCGREFDWDLARDFARGRPADWKPMEDAPTDGSEIMGDVNGVETRMVWWCSWEWWRGLNEDGSVGKPVDPIRWREMTDEDRAGA